MSDDDRPMRVRGDERVPSLVLTGQSLATERRFFAKVDATGPCWLWLGSLNNAGYGKLTVRRVNLYAHRFAHECLVGPVPEGLELDHLCRVRRCVNPDHLEPVTRSENVRRGDSRWMVHRARGIRYGRAA